MPALYDSLAQAASSMVAQDYGVEPDLRRHEQYREVFGFYCDTHAALEPLMHRMARRGEGKQKVETEDARRPTV